MTDREELLRRASELVPILRERAAQTEEMRRLPQETVQDYLDAELLRAAQPTRYGGLGLDYDVMLDVAVELSRGCGSAGWCYSIWASHNYVVGTFPQRAQDEYWADSYDTLSSTSFDPSNSKVTAVEGGYQTSGQWQFSSGCDEATWVLLVGIGPAGSLFMMLPKSDFAIVDTWFVSGLRGTGSKDIVVHEAFVPEHRTISMVDLLEGRSPGQEVNGEIAYKVPLFSFWTFTLTAPVVGMAQGALDAFEERMCNRVSVDTGQKMVDHTSVHLRLAESAAEVTAAHILMQSDTRQILARARRGEMPTIGDRTRYRRDHCYAAKLCVQAVNRLFEGSGGHALFDSSPIQRFHRDVHAASHHVALAWDTAAENFGRVRLGLEPTSHML